MKRFIEGQDRSQVTLLPECLDDYIGEDNPVRVIDAFVDELDLQTLGCEGAEPAATGRPSYHPAVVLKIYVYGYHRIQSSRRLEREAQRNVELMWLTGRLAPDFKTIADFRHDNGKGIRNVCRRFVELCRELKLFSHGSRVASTASGSLKLIIASMRARKKSAVSILESLRNQITQPPILQRNPWAALSQNVSVHAAWRRFAGPTMYVRDDVVYPGRSLPDLPGNVDGCRCICIAVDCERTAARDA